MTPLCHLCRRYGSDKGGARLPKESDTCHNYTPTYYELFKHRRNRVKWVLEIGIGHGFSLRMWRDFFPNAQIIGLDRDPPTINACKGEERIRCFLADQNSQQDLQGVVDRLHNPGFDLIVDDGSHVAGHQIHAARVLLPALHPERGLYVIEDLERDCRPELVAEPIGAHWQAVPTGFGLGRARCECGCGRGEQLLLLW
jgi:hypothetical protein